MEKRYANRLDAPVSPLVDDLIRKIASIALRKADAIEMDAVLNDNRTLDHESELGYLLTISRMNQEKHRKGRLFRQDSPRLAIPVPLDEQGMRVFVDLAPLTIGARAYRQGYLVFDTSDGGTELDVLLDSLELAEVDEWLHAHDAASTDFLEEAS